MIENATTIDGNILLVKDAYYSGLLKQFVKELTPQHEELGVTTVEIEKPVFAIETLHFCYVHMIEDIFRYFWVIQDLLKERNLENNDIVFFIRRNNLMEYATRSDYILAQYFNVIDVNSKSYRGAWRDLFQIVNKNEILFESFLTKRESIYFKQLFIFNDDFWQHSFWNSKIWYPVREIPTSYREGNRTLFPYSLYHHNERVYFRFCDDTIQEKLVQFRKCVLDRVLKTYDEPSKKRRVILINRKHSRTFPQCYFDQIISFFQSSTKVQYNGIHYLEDLTFEEQLRLFNTNDIFVMIHGAGCANILWAKPNSILLQYDDRDSRFIMYNRLASLLGIVSYNIQFGKNHDIGLLETLPL
jgi:hypothetical protein